jgi:hypothetical protein
LKERNTHICMYVCIYISCTMYLPLFPFWLIVVGRGTPVVLYFNFRTKQIMLELTVTEYEIKLHNPDKNMVSSN